jgi:hypothetical protein
MAREEDGNFKVALDWFARNLPNYWQRQADVAKLLSYIATIKTPARAEDPLFMVVRKIKRFVANGSSRVLAQGSKRLYTTPVLHSRGEVQTENKDLATCCKRVARNDWYYPVTR